MNLKIFTSKTKFVFTADNTEQRITGFVHLPIVIDNECHIIEALTVPSLKHDFIFGSDFCQRFAIRIDYLEGSWNVQKKNISLLTSDSYAGLINEVNNLENLSVDKQRVVDNLLRSFDELSSKDRLGRTDKISLTIDTGNAQPFRLRQLLLLLLHINEG